MKKSKLTNRGYKVPKWFKKIKPGAHGSTPSQKRLWRIVSETYREEDWSRSPHCRTCFTHLPSWKDGQLGHFKAYSLCNGMFKYHRRNLALQCAPCNANFHKDNVIGARFIDYLRAMYGEDILRWLEKENLKHAGEKVEDWHAVDCVSTLRPDIVV